MAHSAKLSPKLTISIPKDVVEQQKWAEGQEFVFLVKGKNVLLVPVPKGAEMFGVAQGMPRPGYCSRKALN
jgi:hypothetical protein